MTEKKPQLLIATHNRAKFVEISKLLQHIPYDLVSLADLNISHEVDETGATFEENAVLKAKKYYQLTQLPTLADDSGLEVVALGGQPGIYSKRYAGPHATDAQKCQFLLDKMVTVPHEQRTAQFTSVLALALPGGIMKTYYGNMLGSIATTMRGTPVPEFPYWSIFQCETTGKTCAELRDEGKDPGKHRVIAINKVMADLSTL